jgi:hypothetical protein
VKKQNDRTARAKGAVEKPLREKVQHQDFFTSLGNPRKPRISTFPTAPATNIYLLSGRLEHQNPNPDFGFGINLSHAKNGLDNGVHLKRLPSNPPIASGPTSRMWT